MEQITLTTNEFYLFKQLAYFWYSFIYSNGAIIVTADRTLLENLGYLN